MNTELETENEPLEDKELLLEVCRALVDDPQKVKIEELNKESALTILLIVSAPDDRGKLIGVKGETIRIIRELFSRIVAREHRKVFIEVVDPKRLPAWPKIMEDSSALETASLEVPEEHEERSKTA